MRTQGLAQGWADGGARELRLEWGSRWGEGQGRYLSHHM